MDDLCPKLNIPVIEKNIEPYDVYNADEAFMTGTPFCMLPVTKLNNVNIGSGNVGKIYKKNIEKMECKRRYRYRESDKIVGQKKQEQ